MFCSPAVGGHGAAVLGHGKHILDAAYIILRRHSVRQINGCEGGETS
jgi:hypothetical protein